MDDITVWRSLSSCGELELNDDDEVELVGEGLGWGGKLGEGWSSWRGDWDGRLTGLVSHMWELYECRKNRLLCDHLYQKMWGKR